MSIVRDPEHSDGAPTIEGTGIRVKDVAVAYEHSGYEPDEITQLYPDLSLADVHRALAYYHDNIDDFRSAEPALRGPPIPSHATETGVHRTGGRPDRTLRQPPVGVDLQFALGVLDQDTAERVDDHEKRSNDERRNPDRLRI